VLPTFLLLLVKVPVVATFPVIVVCPLITTSALNVTFFVVITMFSGTGSGFQNDCEKYNEATLHGWRILRFTTNHIKSGYAVQTIQRMLQSANQEATQEDLKEVC